jgi:4-hydroxy 2-oxovalerate aldolase
MTVASKASSFEPSEVEVFDATLREGSYVVDFQLDEKFVIELLGRLDETPLEKIEIGHGIGYDAELAGLMPCNIDLKRWCEIAASELKSSAWGMFAQPEFSRLETLVELCDQGMSFVRLGMTAEQVAGNREYIERAAGICDQVYLNLMKSSSTPAERIPELLGGVAQDLAGLYIVDSYGAMLPADVRRYVAAVKQCAPVIGFHGHDNLGMANANSITALEAGVAIVDGTLGGIGRGAGNAETESLAGILSLCGEDRYDYRALARHAEFSKSGLAALPENRTLQVLGGVIGIHSGFFPLVEKLCAEHFLDPAAVLETAVELAEQAVGKDDIRAAAELLVQRAAAEGTREAALAGAASGGAR